MKILFVVCGILLVTLAVQGRPVCEECDDEAPLAFPDENVLKIVKVPQVKQEQSFEEAAPGSDIQETNIIDAPVVCPEGQKPDHNGKCRPVWNGK
ncbi:AAEL011296-PA [Aedes aegypti]|uniref:AAEL011296-PA n=1 Tax=Aedes aegypti TaxID=7159 RepID=Q16QG6_AEDAE|nr:AAEL011296-PA [Aedes aegypti]